MANSIFAIYSGFSIVFCKRLPEGNATPRGGPLACQLRCEGLLGGRDLDDLVVCAALGTGVVVLVLPSGNVGKTSIQHGYIT